MQYKEDDMLMLSGIQHFMFCPRQWALIHIEQQWAENRLTVEGELLHEHVDDPFYRQKSGETITLRSVSVASKSLGLYGVTDVVELHPSDSPINCITHPKYPGQWKPYPVEYKHGHSKPDERDEVQLAAQAMCLEEMYDIVIDYGALYYAETKRREEITISEHLRELVKELAHQMHSVFCSGKTPNAIRQPHCRNCSLVDLCLPQLSSRQPVNEYLQNVLYEETT